jgi:hypothetical protein
MTGLLENGARGGERRSIRLKHGKGGRQPDLELRQAASPLCEAYLKGIQSFLVKLPRHVSTLPAFQGRCSANMQEKEAAARMEIRAVVEELERIQAVLRGVAESLPVSAAEADRSREGEVTLRSILECVLADSLRPAVSDLRSLLAPERAEGNQR